MEIEPNEQSSGDFSWLARAAKAAKQAGRRPSHAVNKSSELRKVVRSLEEITDALDAPVMLSLQALSERYRNLAVSSQDNLLSPRLGLSVGVMGSDVFCDAISLRNFEDKVLNQLVAVSILKQHRLLCCELHGGLLESTHICFADGTG